MKLFSKKQKETLPVVQTAPKGVGVLHPLLNGSAQSTFGEVQLYSALRESVPVIDAAIAKLVRLLGTFKVSAGDRRGEAVLETFVKRVRTGSGGVGLHSFVYSYFDALLTYGSAVGEMVVSPDMRGVYGLYNASCKDVSIRLGDNPMELVVCRRDAYDTLAESQQLLLCTLLNPTPGTACGNSLLKGLPFVSSILMRIIEAVGQNWDRAGNLRYAVTYNPRQGGAVNASQRAKEIATEWSRAMNERSGVCDFVAVGDVSVKVIGADSQVLDCDIPIKHILEQIVSKLCIPPFLLGLSWSSTERMSAVQADILTSEIEYYRTLLEPVIEKICTTHLRLAGCASDVMVEWSNISLQDEVELSQARLNNARARVLEENQEETD